MTRTSTRLRRVALGMGIAAVVVGLAGCGSGSHASTPSLPALSTPSQSPVTVPDADVAHPPKTPAPVPNGVYRTHLTTSDLTRLGVTNMTDAGTWTLIVENGDYRLQCAPIHDPVQDCGNAQITHSATVEFGFLRGTGPLVYFVHNLKKTKTICPDPGVGCAIDGYKMNWQVVAGGALKFTNWYGYGDEAGVGTPNYFTVRPWTKIG
jgi:hypothetical protein